MSTTHHTWPRQLRLPGQVAAPDGPIDMRMMYVMHHAFRRDLDLFSAAVRNTPAAERATWALLAERWGLFAEALHEHHTIEDEGVWPALERLARPDEVATLTAMEAEHGELDPLLEGCATGFRRLTQHADEDARAALVVRVCAARESLRRHLAHEETEAIAIIQRRLSDADWHQIEEESFKHDIPPRTLLKLVPWVAEGVPADVREVVFSAPGGRMNQALWYLTRGGFRRRQRRALAYVDGPVEVG